MDRGWGLGSGGDSDVMRFALSLWQHCAGGPECVSRRPLVTSSLDSDHGNSRWGRKNRNDV